jgi:hypothetical protein
MADKEVKAKVKVKCRYSDEQIAEHCKITGQSKDDFLAKIAESARKRNAITEAYKLTKKAKAK